MAFTFIAHRGASADAPDNTAAAFHRAIEQEADMIETDVQITQDGVLVLQHDFEISGQLVAASRLSELRALKSDLLTVAAALRDFADKIPFCWEVKSPGVETALVHLARDLTPAGRWAHTHFTSFRFGSALKLRQVAPEATVGWLTRDWNESVIQQVADAGLNQICPPAEVLLENPDLVPIAHAAGLQVRVWQVTRPDLVPGLEAAGIYGGTVNWPARARRALNHSTQAEKRPHAPPD